MHIHRGCDVAPREAGPDEIVCRQSRVGGTLFAAVITAACVGSPIFMWTAGAPWFFPILFGLVALTIVPLLLADVRTRFRPTNWVLWVRPRSLMINLCSYQDRGPRDALSVVELNDDEIAEMWRRTERYTIPKTAGRSVSKWLESLEIKLHAHENTELTAAVAECRKRKQAGMQITLKSVSLPAPGLVRIAWWGGTGHSIAPRLKYVLDKLSHRVHVSEPVDTQRASWDQMSDAEVDDQVLSLISSGSKLDAIKLLRAHREMSLVEAKLFVDELASRS